MPFPHFVNMTLVGCLNTLAVVCHGACAYLWSLSSQRKTRRRRCFESRVEENMYLLINFDAHLFAHLPPFETDVK